MTEGYIYCFSNPSMLGLLKIGMTERTPETRLKEANAPNTWIPTPYKIEFAKKVYNPSNKEKKLHTLLEKYTERINPRREFFRTSTEEVLRFFDLMDGEMWVENSKLEDTNSDDSDDDYDDKNSTDCAPVKTSLKGELCRDMKRCFTDGQRIRHILFINKDITNTWEGIYNSSINSIVYNGEALTLNQFTTNHYTTERPDRTSKNNAWDECECEVNGKWISTYSLSPL